MRHLLLVSLTIGSVVACGSGGGGGGGGGPSTSIAKAGAPNGDAQTANVGAALSESLRVVVQADGSPKSGATVSWITANGGTLSPITSQTDAAGLAATKWTLGTVAGSQSVNATLTGATGSPVAFTANASPGPAAQLTLNGGNAQIGLTGVDLPNALSVKVADVFGNGVSGTTVNWSVLNGTLVLANPSSVSSAGGTAVNVVTAGSVEGTAQVRANAPAAGATNIDFSVTFFRAMVTVGSNFFTSDRNGTQDTAIDTVQAGQSVRWSVSGTHTVESTGSPSFVSSGQLTTGSTYTLTFNTPGTYNYDCAIHGGAMTGRIVVLP